MKVILATNNRHKVKEIREILGKALGETLTLEEAGVHADPEENGATFEENALIKAREICRLTSLPALSDDSGLCVDALDGAPGVRSARYSGGGSEENIALLLENLRKAEERGERDRTAHFSCAVALVFPDGREITAEGRIYGYITDRPMGGGGFGYDPVFFSTELGKTFAQADEEEKNSVSHRGRALRALEEKL